MRAYIIAREFGNTPVLHQHSPSLMGNGGGGARSDVGGRRHFFAPRGNDTIWLPSWITIPATTLAGASVGAQRNNGLTQVALLLAFRKRSVAPGLIFHSDRDIEYVAFGFRATLLLHDEVLSMNCPGQISDNAHMEFFFHSMKTEACYGRNLDSDDQVREAVADYIRCYSYQHLHSALRYLSIVAFEQHFISQSCAN